MTGPDPFWDEVHRLLPDVDVVLLPPPAAPPGSPDSRLVGTVRARWAVQATLRTFGTAWQRLLPDLPRPATVRRVWRSDSAAGSAGALVRLELTGGYGGSPVAGVGEVLAAARAAVEAAGGAVDEQRWSAAGGLRLVTDLAGHVLEISAGTEPPRLTAVLVSPPLPVPPDLAADLAAGGAEHLPF